MRTYYITEATPHEDIMDFVTLLMESEVNFTYNFLNGTFEVGSYNPMTFEVIAQTIEENELDITTD